MDCGLIKLFTQKSKLNRGLEDCQRLVLKYLKNTNTKTRIETLNVPFCQLGFNSVTDFVRNIPAEMVSEFKLTDDDDIKNIFKNSDRIVWTDSKGHKQFGKFKKYAPKQGEAIIHLDINSKGKLPRAMTVSVKNLEHFKSFLKTHLPNLPERSNVTIIRQTSYQERPIDVGNDSGLGYPGENQSQGSVDNANNIRPNLEPSKHSMPTEVKIANIYADPRNWKPGCKFINKEGKIATMIDSYFDTSDRFKVQYQLEFEKKKNPQHYKECLASEFFAYWDPVRPITSNTTANEDDRMEVDQIDFDDDTNIFEDSNIITSSSGNSDKNQVNLMETEIAGEPEREEQQRIDNSAYYNTNLSPPVLAPQRNSIARRKIRAVEKRHHNLNPHYSTPSASMKPSSKSARCGLDNEKQILETIKTCSGKSVDIASHSNNLISEDNSVTAITSQKDCITTATLVPAPNAKATKENSNLWMQRKTSQEGRDIEQSSPRIINSSMNSLDNYNTRYPQQKQIEIPEEANSDSNIFSESTTEYVSQRDTGENKLPKIKSPVIDISPNNNAFKLAEIKKKVLHSGTNLSLRAVTPTKPPRSSKSNSHPPIDPSSFRQTSSLRPIDPSNIPPIDPSSLRPIRPSSLPPIPPSSIPQIDLSSLPQIHHSSLSPIHPSSNYQIHHSSNYPINPSSLPPIHSSKHPSKPQRKYTLSNQMSKEMSFFSDNQSPYGNVNESKERKRDYNYHHVDGRSNETRKDDYHYPYERQETSKNDNYDNDINEMMERRKDEFRNEIGNHSTIKSSSPSSDNRQKEKTIVMNDNYKNSIPILKATLEDKISIACGNRHGIQWSKNSCFMDATLFSFYYWSKIFDKITLSKNKNDNELTREVKRILRENIVTPLRNDRYVSAAKADYLRKALTTFSNKMDGSFMDVEEFMFILFEQALKLRQFIRYTEDTEDFLHQIVLHSDDASSKFQSVQNLFEYSLKTSGDMKLLEMPNPALILVMPRSNGRLIRYEAIVPNLTLDMTPFFENGPKFCLCNNTGEFECTRCNVENGEDAIVYCEACKHSAFPIHDGIHDPKLVAIPKNLMELTAVICIRDRHYTAFARAGKSLKWLFFDSMYPQVQLAEDLGEILEFLAQKPKQYRAAIKQNNHIRRILTDSHVCIYQPMSISTQDLQ